MKMTVTGVVVGERRREDYGGIAGLAASIDRYGLLHPIVVDGDGRLVAGGRRLEAVKSLGWTSIEIRSLGDLSSAERDEIELEENLQRKDLTPYERAKQTVLKAQRVAPIISAKLAEKAPQGRKSIHEAPRADVAQAIGTSETALRRDEQHVEIAEAIPVLAGPDVKQYHALEARETLSKLPETERPRAVALVNQPGVPPKDAVAILGNLAAMPAPERTRVLTLAESQDGRDRSLALTEAAKLPAMPDERISLLIDAVATIGKAERLYPDDPMTPHIKSARDAAREVLSALKEYRRDA